MDYEETTKLIDLLDHMHRCPCAITEICSTCGDIIYVAKQINKLHEKITKKQL